MDIYNIIIDTIKNNKEQIIVTIKTMGTYWYNKRKYVVTTNKNTKYQKNITINRNLFVNKKKRFLYVKKLLSII